MKKITSLHLLFLLVFSATCAQAEECCDQETCCVDQPNFYTKILGGFNFLQTSANEGIRAKYQTGYIISASLGYTRCHEFYVEAEYSFRRNNLRKIHFSGRNFSMEGHFQSSSYMANLLWNLPLSSWNCSFWDIKPFIGGGIGYDFQQRHASNSFFIYDQKWHHFSWQVMAGLSTPIFCNTEVTLEYKFHQGGCHFYNHSIGIGLVYKFGL